MSDNHRFYLREIGRGFKRSFCVEFFPGNFCRDFLSEGGQISGTVSCRAAVLFLRKKEKEEEICNEVDQKNSQT